MLLLSFARLRLLPLSLLSLLTFSPCNVDASSDTIFTSSVSYCSPPQSLLIQQFYVQYFAQNSTVFFNVSAASVEPNLDVDANLLLNVYGMSPFNLTLNLCNVLSGALCPLPTYNFTGSQYIPLAELDATVVSSVQSEIPGIAYKIPDLEAFAQLTLTERSTGQLKACVQSTLSNGESTRQTSVQWTTGGIALLSFISALWHSLSPESIVPSRFVEFIFLFQNIVISALLGLNYPVVYSSFASNFSWSIGLFTASASSRIQNAINNMRHLTGGNLEDASGGSAIDLINRKLSPYSIPASQGVQALSASQNVFKRSEIATVTNESPNVLEAGIPVFVNSLGISTANGFMSIFFTGIILAAIVIGTIGIIWLGLRFCVRERKGPQTRFEEAKDKFGDYITAWGVRLSLIAFAPIAIFAFDQWTLKDSWLSILLSVLSLVTLLVLIAYPTIKTILLAKRNGAWALYSHSDHFTSYGPLYGQYRQERWHFFLILLLFGLVAKSLFVGFADPSGLTQVIALLVIEIFIFLSLIILKPHERRSGRVLSIFLAVVRVVTTGLLFAFVESFNIMAIPRVAIGIVMAVIYSIAIIVMIVNAIVNIGLLAYWADRLRFVGGARLRSRGEGDSSVSVVDPEKGGNNAADGNVVITRPSNPTPERFMPLDRHVIRIYPPSSDDMSSNANYPLASPPATVSNKSSSGSTTLGSELPRRQSFEGLGLEQYLIASASVGDNDFDSPSPSVGSFYSSAHSHRDSSVPDENSNNGNIDGQHRRQISDNSQMSSGAISLEEASRRAHIH